MNEIKSKNVDAYNYLVKIPLEKWTLVHDGGHRHGMMTTNISKILNSILKRLDLTIESLVKLIFRKVVRYFNQHH